MKTPWGRVLAVIVGLAAGAALSFAGPDVRFGFSLSGGLGHIDGGDLNRHIRDENQWIVDYEDYVHENLYDIDWKEMSWLPKFGGEIMVRIGRYFGLGAGVEFLKKTNPGTIDYAFTDSSTVDYGGWYYLLNENTHQSTTSITQTLTVVPVTLSVYGFLPLGPGAEAYVKLGGGYYLGKLASDWVLDSEDISNHNYYWYSGPPFPPHYHTVITGTETEAYEATCNTFGVHFGAGFDFNVSRNIAFFAEAFYRMANFTEWEGSLDWTVDYLSEWGETDSTEPIDLPESDTMSASGGFNGGLWYSEYFWNELATGLYGQIGLFENKPQEGYTVKNSRPAEINLNGFAFKVGIRIFFGGGR